VVKCLSSKHEVLSSNPSTIFKKRKKKNESHQGNKNGVVVEEKRAILGRGSSYGGLLSEGKYLG
jgi:hypothetical protein